MSGTGAVSGRKQGRRFSSEIEPNFFVPGGALRTFATGGMVCCFSGKQAVLPLAWDVESQVAEIVLILIPAGLDLDPFKSGREGKAFFSEEKKQKTFGPAVAECPSANTPGNKSFLVRFFKKEPLASVVTVET